MIKKWLIRCVSFLGIMLITACTLPEVTPPVETVVPVETSFVPSTADSPTETAIPVPEPVEITPKNAVALTAVYRSAMINPQQLVWSPDSLSLSVTTQNTDTTGNQVFGISILTVPDLLPTGIYSTQDGRVSDIASDGKKAAVISLDMTSVSVIDLGAGNAVLFPIAPGFLIGNATFSPDGTYLALSKMESWEVVLYSVADGSEIRTLTGFETAAPVYEAGFKQSPQWMVWHARGTLQLQEVESGKFGSPLSHEDFVVSYALTRDGSIVASSASKMIDDASVPAVILWDAVAGTELRTLALQSSAQCLGFSPNGTMLAIGSGNALQIWDVASGEMLVSVEEHAGQINNLAFSPDGKFIATAGLDNQLYLWQVSQ